MNIIGLFNFITAKNKGGKQRMEKNMKPSEEKKKDTLIDIMTNINQVSQIGSSYGRLSELKDLQMHIQTRINELEKQIKETDPLKQ